MVDIKRFGFVLIFAAAILPHSAWAGAPAGAVRLAASKMFQARVSSKTYLCGNLPPWSPGRMVSGAFYPTARELTTLKGKLRSTRGAALKSLKAKIAAVTKQLAAGKSACRNGPPQATIPTPAPPRSTPTPVPASGNPFFDAVGNVTSAGKAAFRIPSNLSASVNAGIATWNQTCNGCHHTQPSRLGSRSFPEMKARIQQSPMFFAVPGEVSEQQIANVTAYANF